MTLLGLLLYHPGNQVRNVKQTKASHQNNKRKWCIVQSKEYIDTYIHQALVFYVFSINVANINNNFEVPGNRSILALIWMSNSDCNLHRNHYIIIHNHTPQIPPPIKVLVQWAETHRCEHATCARRLHREKLASEVWIFIVLMLEMQLGCCGLCFWKLFPSCLSFPACQAFKQREKVGGLSFSSLKGKIL